MPEILLTHGLVTVVDDADYEALAAHRWHAYRDKWNCYAQRRDYAAERWIRMHRAIVGASPGDLVDHRDHDGLNNRRANLRVASHLQNSANARKCRRRGGTTSAFKGVSFDRTRALWASHIKGGGRRINLGRFQHEIDAALAYDAAAIEHFGEFACLNFPVEGVARTCRAVPQPEGGR